MNDVAFTGWANVSKGASNNEGWEIRKQEQEQEQEHRQQGRQLEQQV